MAKQLKPRPSLPEETRNDDITVIVYEREALPVTKEQLLLNLPSSERSGSWIGDVVERHARVSPETLQSNLSAFLSSVQKAIDGIPLQLGNYSLEEMELSLEVGAEGQIGLLGTGGKLSGRGSISLKLKRSSGPTSEPATRSS